MIDLYMAIVVCVTALLLVRMTQSHLRKDRESQRLHATAIAALTPPMVRGCAHCKHQADSIAAQYQDME